MVFQGFWVNIAKMEKILADRTSELVKSISELEIRELVRGK
jgi:hypothetical protein